ncbi:MAG: hypothetical protein A2V88_05575 [Elusimicrobia bacterium RBG_16_66_12]|nr:MAG: hypothetical protein A2V88_05575 [Elusimicrobia bacterium RBG_16_66_12]
MHAPPEPVERMWKTSQFLPQTVRLLGTRYRALFLAHAQLCRPSGDAGTVADAMAFVDFMFRQERVGLLDNERRALLADKRALRRRFRLKRNGEDVSASEKWKILQWIGL